MVANVNMLELLPNYCGHRWQARQPLSTTCRSGPVWEPRLITAGTVLEFSGWAGVGDRSEPFASFVATENPDLRGWIVFLPIDRIDRWCSKLPVKLCEQHAIHAAHDLGGEAGGA